MAKATVEFSVPFDQAISAFFRVSRPNNGTAELVESRRLRTEGRAVNLAPRRSGNLAAQHRSIAARNQGNDIIAEVSNLADYAVYVHEGTNGTSGLNQWEGWGPWGGYIYGAPGGVSGQDANPWLARAYNEVASSDTRTTKFSRLPESSKRGRRNASKKWARPI
jgi:hypothetical protein